MARDLFQNLPVRVEHAGLASLHDRYGTTRMVPWHVAVEALGDDPLAIRDDTLETVRDGGYLRLRHRPPMEVIRERWIQQYAPVIDAMPPAFTTAIFAARVRVPFMTANAIISALMAEKILKKNSSPTGDEPWIVPGRFDPGAYRHRVVQPIPTKKRPKRKIVWGAPVRDRSPRRVIWAST